ncbi:MAG: RluA family pseudouridine synthase [Sphingopyxis sp.]|jgi:23S rRNA pseudouridine955/2504/2580 synthase|nr:RluA family pseudouridine synthase [Sphingopyxis sp.]
MIAPGTTHRIIADDDGIRVDRWFQRHQPDVPHGLIARWTRTGLVRVDGAKVDPSARLSTGQTITVPAHQPEPRTGPRVRRVREVSAEDAAMAEAMVIHRDAAAIVLNKPPGLATQGGTGTTTHVDGLLDAFVGADGVRPRLVHRLDKDTSGVLLVARTPGSAAKFSRSFAGRSARKIYWAIVTGVPSIDEGQIDLALAKQPGSGGEKMHVDEADGLPSTTRYRVIQRAGNVAAFVELQPLTGRTHQLRVHMAAIGHPIVGDGKYGGKAAFLTGAISRKLHLHARRLRIDNPAGGKIDVTAALPDHFAESLAGLGFDEELGDAVMHAVPERAPAAVIEKEKARAHAKQLRKERRGERRGRGANASPKKPARPPAKTARDTRPAGKAGAKPVRVRGKSAPNGPPRGKGR